MRRKGGKLFQILRAIEHPGEGFDRGMNEKLLDQMVEMAPAALEDLRVIDQ